MQVFKTVEDARRAVALRLEALTLAWLVMLHGSDYPKGLTEADLQGFLQHSGKGQGEGGVFYYTLKQLLTFIFDPECPQHRFLGRVYGMYRISNIGETAVNAILDLNPAFPKLASKPNFALMVENSQRQVRSPTQVLMTRPSPEELHAAMNARRKTLPGFGSG